MKLSSKKVFVILFVSVITFSKTQAQSLKTALDSLSYAIGINVGDNIRNQKLDVNPDILARAIKDAIANNKSVMTSESSSAFIQSYFQRESDKVGNENKARGETFLSQNKSKPGVTTLNSGLQYKILKMAEGPKPAASDRVKVHYHGTLIDGTVFDSSVNRGEPATFGVTQVIKGWVEALQLMSVGSKWTLYIPSDLAYGQQAPPSIGPNQVLIFDVELIEIVK
ncbi:MAG: FKBP-type peptidyl-prolyl cis-trans isomerase [Cytophagaceae bacterium]|nr:FKBP-type peptidyl-prolyl cis-trans isomerase [Cytophagaceae bacterium]